MKAWWFVIAGLALSVLMLGSTYNSLVKNEEAIATQVGVVCTQEQRRYDLIPNLIRTVEASANYERGLLNEVTQARSRVGELLKIDNARLTHNPELQKQFLQAQQQMAGALSRLIATAEAYPDLKATEGFLTLQAQLEGTENRIAVARRDVQLAINNYNRVRRSLPFGPLAATMGGFSERSYFQSEEEAKRPPTVQFNLNTSTKTP